MFFPPHIGRYNEPEKTKFSYSIYYISVCEKFQTTRVKVALVNLIYGSHFSATEATYKVSLNMGNFVEFTKPFTRIKRKPVLV